MVDKKKKADDEKSNQTFSFAGELTFGHPAIIAVILERRKARTASCLKDFVTFGIIVKL